MHIVSEGLSIVGRRTKEGLEETVGEYCKQTAITEVKMFCTSINKGVYILYGC